MANNGEKLKDVVTFLSNRDDELCKIVDSFKEDRILMKQFMTQEFITQYVTEVMYGNMMSEIPGTGERDFGPNKRNQWVKFQDFKDALDLLNNLKILRTQIYNLDL